MNDKKVIVIVEDDELALSLYKRLLSKKYELVFYRNGEEFIDTINRQKHFHLAIIDLSLRGKLSGIDVIEYLKGNESTKHIPTICITAHAFPKDKRLAMDVGADGFFAKPVDNKLLLNTIEKHLSVKNEHEVSNIYK